MINKVIQQRNIVPIVNGGDSSTTIFSAQDFDTIYKAQFEFFNVKVSSRGMPRPNRGHIEVKCQTMRKEVLRSMEDMISNGNDHEMLKRSAPAASKGDWRKYLTSRAMLL